MNFHIRMRTIKFRNSHQTHWNKSKEFQLHVPNIIKYQFLFEDKDCILSDNGTPNDELVGK